MMIKDKLTKSMIINSLCFGACFFVFQLSEFTINDRANILFGAEYVNLIYSIGIGFTALGFILFSMINKNKNYKNLFIFLIILSMFTFTIMMMTNLTVLFLLSSFLSLLLYGMINAYYYYQMAIVFYNSKYLGRTTGFSMACGVLLQFVVQNILETRISFIISVILCTLMILYFFINNNEEFQNIVIKEDKQDNNHLNTIILSTILMTLVISLIDGVVVLKHAQGYLSVSSYSRLFYCLSLFIAGIVADIKDRKYMSLVTICFLFISAISTAFISNSSTFFLSTTFMYIYSGFYVMYFTISFIDYSIYTNNILLWPSMGRIIRSIVTAITTIPIMWMFKRFSSISLIIGSCILSVLTLLVLIKDISISIFFDEFKNKMIPSSINLDSIPLYCEKHKFTSREKEVFELLITTENNVQEIADSLYISRRVLQRYISSIYEKTNTKSRIGLYQNFSRFKNDII